MTCLRHVAWRCVGSVHRGSLFTRWPPSGLERCDNQCDINAISKVEAAITKTFDGIMAVALRYRHARCQMPDAIDVCNAMICHAM